MNDERIPVNSEGSDELDFDLRFRLSDESLSRSLRAVRRAEAETLLRREQPDAPPVPDSVHLPTRMENRQELVLLPLPESPAAVIGQGGQAVIYSYLQRELGREVAVKTLRPERRNVEAVEELIREACVTARLEHPNIVPVHYLHLPEHADDTPYWVMKLIRGKPLTAHLPGGSDPWAFEKLLDVFHRVLEAVGFAHSRGIVHRDLKPENVLVGAFGEVQVTDWGLAVAITEEGLRGAAPSSTLLDEGAPEHGARESRLPPEIARINEDVRSGSMGALSRESAGGRAGTPVYMAPEQMDATAKRIDAQTDVFLLGGILYAILTGTPPHDLDRRADAQAARDRLEAIRSCSTISPPAERRRKLGLALAPEGVSAVAMQSLSMVIMKALSADPSQRHRSVEDLALALDRWQAQSAADELHAQAQTRYAEARQQPRGGARAYAEAISLANAALARLPGHEEAERLRDRAAAALADIQKKSTRRLVASASAIVLVFVVGAVGYERTRAQRNIARQQRSIAEQQGVKAVAEAEEARRQRARAEEESRRAEQQRIVAETQRETAQREAARAEAERQRAETEKQRAEEQRATAEREKEKARQEQVRAENEKAKAEEERGKALAAERRAEEGRDRAMLEAYFSQIALAERKLEDGDVGVAEALLDQCPTNLRHWEWNRLKYLCDLAVAALRGHSAAVEAVAYSPDGRRIASGGSDRTLRVWDVETQREIFCVAMMCPVADVAFSPDGKTVAAACVDYLTIRNTETGEELRSLLEHHVMLGGTVRRLAFSPDGSHLAYAVRDQFTRGGADEAWKRGEIQLAGPGIWNQPIKIIRSSDMEMHDRKKHGTLTANEPDGEPVSALAYRPDGKRLVSGGEGGTLRIWDLGSGGKPWGKREMRSWSGGVGEITSVAYSPDGKAIACAGAAPLMKVWDAETARELLSIPAHGSSLCCLRFSPDGTRLASAGLDGTIRLWDAKTGEALFALRGHRRSVFALDFSPDGKFLASGSGDHTVRLWSADVDRSALWLQSGTPEGETQLVAFSSDGRWMALNCARHEINVFSMTAPVTRVAVTGHKTKVIALAFSPDGKRIASLDDGGFLIVCDAATGNQLITEKGASRLTKDPVIEGSYLPGVFSPDGALFAAAMQSGLVQVWDTTAANHVTTLGRPGDRANSLAFSPDGRWLASSQRGGVVWEVKTGREIWAAPPKSLNRWFVSFTPGGKRLICSGDSAALWDIESNGKLAGELDSPFTISGDGSRLGGRTPRGIAVWDTGSGTKIAELKNAGGLDLLAFSPDGKCVLGRSRGHPVRLWNASTGQEKPLRGAVGEGWPRAFSPDGRRLAMASVTNAGAESSRLGRPTRPPMSIGLWELETGREVISLKGHAGGAHQLLFSPDGNWIIAVDQDTKVVTVWESIEK